MKVTDIRRKLIAALAAGGLLAPSAAGAANLNVNLVTNADFESVDLGGAVGAYNSPPINGWTASAPEKQGFAYSHNGSLGPNGMVVPDYGNGAPLASGGNWYFTPNAGPNNAVINGAGQFFQDIDVSGGASGSLIATGNAAFRVSGFFNSFASQGDVGHVQLDFRNSSNTSVGTAELVPSLPLNEWTPTFLGGTIPAATRNVRVSLFGTTPIAGGPDGYIDNVDFQVTNEVILPSLSINVDRLTGTITLNNQTGSAKNLASYSITSAFEAVAPANWRSIADNYDSGNPGPNQVDPAHAWTKLTTPAVKGDLSEADMASGDGASLAAGRIVTIGNAGAWVRTNQEDLSFSYVSNGAVVQGLINYIGGGQAGRGDLNFDGAITAADWAIVRNNQNANLSNMSLAEAYRLGDFTSDRKNDHADFTAFKALFDAANGVGAFTAMLAAVPEASTSLLVLTAGILLVPLHRKAAKSTRS